MRLLALAVILLGLPAGLVAQQAGDLLATRSDGLYKIDRLATTSVKIASLSGASRIIAATENDGVLVQSGRSAFHVRNGVVTPFAQFPNTASIDGMIVDQTGDYVVLDATRNVLLNVARGTATISTLTSVPAGCRCITRDFETGGYALGCGSSVLGVSRSGAISTLFTASNLVLALEHLPHRDHFAMISFDVKVYDRNGVEQASHNMGPNVRGMAVDWQAGHLYLRAEDLDYWIETIDLTTYGRSSWNYRSFDFDDLAVFGSRRATGIGSGRAGTNYRVSLRFHGSPNTYYCGAIALDNQPSIQLGNGYQTIKPDALFFQSLCGGLPVFTQGFTGTTDNLGRASMQFPLPAFAVGLKIYATASALSGTIDHANVVCVLIE